MEEDEILLLTGSCMGVSSHNINILVTYPQCASGTQEIVDYEI